MISRCASHLNVQRGLISCSAVTLMKDYRRNSKSDYQPKYLIEPQRFSVFSPSFAPVMLNCDLSLLLLSIYLSQMFPDFIPLLSTNDNTLSQKGVLVCFTAVSMGEQLDYCWALSLAAAAQGQGYFPHWRWADYFWARVVYVLGSVLTLLPVVDSMSLSEMQHLSLV